MTVDEENKFKFQDASLPENSRDLVLHKGDLNLSEQCFSWKFGRTQGFTDEQLQSYQQELQIPADRKISLATMVTELKEIDAKDSAFARQPQIALHPNNKERKVPGDQGSHFSLSSLRPCSKGNTSK